MGGGGHHHHGGGGGWRGGFPPYGPGYGYPWQAPATEVFVVDDTDKLERVLAHVMSLPKNQRKAAYEKLTGRAAPASLGEYMQSRAADTLALGYLPTPGAPESLGCGGGCGCKGCGGMGATGSVLDAVGGAGMVALAIGALYVGHRLLGPKRRRR